MPLALWIFGYGSLLWKRSHPSADIRPCYIEDYGRRLWQGSPDHRGTPDRPGRVATLVHAPGERCWGLAQRIPSKDVDETLRQLDIREQAGYERLTLSLYDENGRPWTEGITYRASETNPHFLGPASDQDIADYVASCHGPSGSNRDYVLKLAEALRCMDINDPHVRWPAEKLQRNVGDGAHV